MRLLDIFPDPLDAGEDEYLCVGGSLEPEFLVNAYARGIFPWYSEGDSILWHCPHPRCVLYPADFHISSRSRRKILHSSFVTTLNTAFAKVIDACSAPRKGAFGTWILPEIKIAYMQLFKLGYAHSVEVWQSGELVGGLYGVALGNVFFGESMFRVVSESSRASLAALVNLLRMKGFGILDCQQATPHMLEMGAKEISRQSFLRSLTKGIGSLEPTGLATIKGQIPLGL